MIVGGVDIGSSSAKAVLLEGTEIVSSCVMPTGPSSARIAFEVMDKALSARGLSWEHLRHVVSTGYGRINVPFANKNITEISCHARGVAGIFPNVRTILDMGGQDCKAIQCDERGKVTEFLMNDKCAAGTGRYLERIATALKVSLQDIGPLSLQTVEGPTPISSFCTVFAQNDTILLLRQGKHLNDIMAGVCEALTERIQTLIQRVGLVRDFAVSGGIAKNVGIVKRLERNFGVTAFIAPDPQIMGALGAAFFAQELQ